MRDDNRARDGVVKQYLKEADAIWIVSHINRATNDKTAKVCQRVGWDVCRHMQAHLYFESYVTLQLYHRRHDVCVCARSDVYVCFKEGGGLEQHNNMHSHAHTHIHTHPFRIMTGPDGRGVPPPTSHGRCVPSAETITSDDV